MNRFVAVVSLFAAAQAFAAESSATVTYRLASNGSVVMETLMPGTPHEMISMYHLDGAELVMTHYCAGGNQPRMKLDTAASTKDELKFAFVGGTNLDPAKDGHIHAGALKFEGAGLISDWTFWAGGKEQGHNVFNLKRASGAAAPAPANKPAAAPQHKH